MMRRGRGQGKRVEAEWNEEDSFPLFHLFLHDITVLYHLNVYDPDVTVLKHLNVYNQNVTVLDHLNVYDAPRGTLGYQIKIRFLFNCLIYFSGLYPGYQKV